MGVGFRGLFFWPLSAPSSWLFLSSIVSVLSDSIAVGSVVMAASVSSACVALDVMVLEIEIEIHTHRERHTEGESVLLDECGQDALVVTVTVTVVSIRFGWSREKTKRHENRVADIGPQTDETTKQPTILNENIHHKILQRRQQQQQQQRNTVHSKSVHHARLWNILTTPPDTVAP